MENTLFLGMEPRLALKASCDNHCAKIQSQEKSQSVVTAMEAMVAGGESLANVAKQFPNLFSQVAVGLLEAGEGSGSLDESFRSIRFSAPAGRHRAPSYADDFASRQSHCSWRANRGNDDRLRCAAIRSILDYLGGNSRGKQADDFDSNVVTSSPALVAVGLVTGITPSFRLPSCVKNHAWTHRLVTQIPGVGGYLLAGIRTNSIVAFAQLKKNKLTNPNALDAAKRYQLVLSVQDSDCSSPHGSSFG